MLALLFCVFASGEDDIDDVMSTIIFPQVDPFITKSKLATPPFNYYMKTHDGFNTTVALVYIEGESMG